MNLAITDFLSQRVDTVAQNLLQTNGEYALAIENNALLFENISSVIHRGSSITLSPDDCLDFCEYFEGEAAASALLRQELYKQGHLDCVKLLTLLGVLT